MPATRVSQSISLYFSSFSCIPYLRHINNQQLIRPVAHKRITFSTRTSSHRKIITYHTHTPCMHVTHTTSFSFRPFKFVDTCINIKMTIFGKFLFVSKLTKHFSLYFVTTCGSPRVIHSRCVRVNIFVYSCPCLKAKTETTKIKCNRGKWCARRRFSRRTIKCITSGNVIVAVTFANTIGWHWSGDRSR